MAAPERQWLIKEQLDLVGSRVQRDRHHGQVGRQDRLFVSVDGGFPTGMIGLCDKQHGGYARYVGLDSHSARSKARYGCDIRMVGTTGYIFLTLDHPGRRI